MDNKSFTTTFLVAQSPKEAFDGITKVRGWWSENIEGGAAKLNDEFTYSVDVRHRCKMKLTEVVPDKKVVWDVLYNYFNFIKDETEWDGTKIIFEISDQNGQTEVRFTHAGLLPGLECYNICSNAWTGYINNSLRKLITTGKGSPNPKE